MHYRRLHAAERIEQHRPATEANYSGWLDTSDKAEQTRLEREIQLTALDQSPFIPLGRSMPRAAWSKNVSQPLKGPAALTEP